MKKQKRRATEAERRKRRLLRTRIIQIERITLLFIVIVICIFAVKKICGIFGTKSAEASYAGTLDRSEDAAQASEDDSGNSAEPGEGSLSGKIIVVDAGHGGKDQGTAYETLLEKDIVLQIALKLQRELADRGATVCMTRNSDTFVELEDRAEYANENNADLFLSIHVDYYEDSEEIQGLTCHYMPGSASGLALANRISDVVEKSGICSVRDPLESDFRVLKNTVMPAVLVETGYFSNSTDRANLTDEEFQKELAEAIAEGIAEYLD